MDANRINHYNKRKSKLKWIELDFKIEESDNIHVDRYIFSSFILIAL